MTGVEVQEKGSRAKHAKYAKEELRNLEKPLRASRTSREPSILWPARKARLPALGSLAARPASRTRLAKTFLGRFFLACLACFARGLLSAHQPLGLPAARGSLLEKLFFEKHRHTSDSLHALNFDRIERASFVQSWLWRFHPSAREVGMVREQHSEEAKDAQQGESTFVQIGG